METRLDELWFARLELMFSCSLCITGQIGRGLSNPEAISVDLALISTFEDLPNPPSTVLGKEGCRIVYAAKGTPCLYVVPLSHCACRVPLMPCFLRGNSKPTIPWQLRGRYNSPKAGLKADSAPDKGDGSRLFQLNKWLWRFGRGRPRTPGQTVAEANQARANAKAERAGAGAATRKRRKEGTAAARTGRVGM